jgi:hypothetical protein
MSAFYKRTKRIIKLLTVQEGMQRHVNSFYFLLTRAVFRRLVELGY